MSRGSRYTPARATSAESVAIIAACPKRCCATAARTDGPARCWASINNKDDQLYKVSRELFKSQAVSSSSPSAGTNQQRVSAPLRAPQLDRDRVTSLGEAPIPQLKKLEAGIVLFGHNWNDEQVLKTQRQNFKWFGWKTPAALSFNWQYTGDAEEESLESYLGSIEEFGALLQIGLAR